MPRIKQPPYMWCYKLRQKAYVPREYCFGDSKQHPARNPWGCWQAKMPLGSELEWLSYGHFDTDGTFIFDKKKIAHYVFANIEEFRGCPALNMNHIRKVLKIFPETINPKIDKDWKYQEPIFRKLEAEIKIHIGKSEDKIVHPVGVKPASIEAVERIINKIFNKIF